MMRALLTLGMTFFFILLPFFVYTLKLTARSEKQNIPGLIKNYTAWGLFFSILYLLFFLSFNKLEMVAGLKRLSGRFNLPFIAISCTFSFTLTLIDRALRKRGVTFDADWKRIPGIIRLSLVIFFFLTSAASVIAEIYGIISTEQFIYHLMSAKTGANYSVVYKGAVRVALKTAIYAFCCFRLFSVRIRSHKEWSLYVLLFGRFKKLSIILAAALPLAAVGYILNAVGFFQYLQYTREVSSFYEENYIFRKQETIRFPEDKRNLIVILVESLETGFLPIEDGGAFTEDLMPEVAALAKNNINFSGGRGIGGMAQLYGTEWTMAGITALYSGLPLAVRHLNHAKWNDYGSLGADFLPRGDGIGDILLDAGYTSYFILGSNIEFGGRDKYFNTHKDTVIYDYHYFHDNNYIPSNYKVWWGIEDRKLYHLAKSKITEISRRKEPFFITLLTADTHPSDGYLDGEAEIIFDSQYKNVIRDMSKQLYDFTRWLEQQDFYSNTTVVILGDHLYQDSSFFPEGFKIQKLASRYEPVYLTENKPERYNRHPLNIFINSRLDGGKTKNRLFSHFDMMPALIESIGGVINADGLALGRSMSGTTLLEQYGEEELNRQLQLKSNLYDSFWTDAL